VHLPFRAALGLFLATRGKSPLLIVPQVLLPKTRGCSGLVSRRLKRPLSQKPAALCRSPESERPLLALFLHCQTARAQLARTRPPASTLCHLRGHMPAGGTANKGLTS